MPPDTAEKRELSFVSATVARGVDGSISIALFDGRRESIPLVLRGSADAAAVLAAKIVLSLACDDWSASP